MVKNKTEKARFGMVGAISTSIDFGILFILHAVGLTSLIANFISTTTAFTFSFTANRHYTFKATAGNVRRQIILFLIVTLFGLWVIQPVIIHFTEPVFGTYGLIPWQSLLAAKLIATGVTLVWNYVFYSKVVFRKPSFEL